MGADNLDRDLASKISTWPEKTVSQVFSNLVKLGEKKFGVELLTYTDSLPGT